MNTSTFIRSLALRCRDIWTIKLFNLTMDTMFTLTNLKMLAIRSICTVYWFVENCCEDPVCCADVTTCCQGIKQKIMRICTAIPSCKKSESKHVQKALISWLQMLWSPGQASRDRLHSPGCPIWCSFARINSYEWRLAEIWFERMTHTCKGVRIGMQRASSAGTSRSGGSALTIKLKTNNNSQHCSTREWTRKYHNTCTLTKVVNLISATYLHDNNCWYLSISKRFQRVYRFIKTYYIQMNL